MESRATRHRSLTGELPFSPMHAKYMSLADIATFSSLYRGYDLEACAGPEIAILTIFVR